MIFGKKRRVPIMIAAIEAIKTEAAATSFAILASLRISGLTIFTIDSKEVLINSKIRTEAMVRVRMAHSTGESFITSPKRSVVMPSKT